MKTLKNWEKFNEEIYPGWTTDTTSNIPSDTPNKPVNLPMSKVDPEDLTGTPILTKSNYKTFFQVPVAVEKEFNDEKYFGYSENIREICNLLEKDGYDTSWFQDQYGRWEENQRNSTNEPERDDYDSEEEFNTAFNEFEEWEPSIEQFIKDEWEGNWDKFLKEFQLVGEVCDVTNNKERNEIFNDLKNEFNESNLVQYFDEAKDLEITDMKVIGEDFDEESRFTIQVSSEKDLSEEDIKIIIEYISGQCSDGFGEGFEQQDVAGYSVHTWWSDRRDYNTRPYKIFFHK